MKDEIILNIVLMLKDMGYNTENVAEKLYILLKDVTISRAETALAIRSDDFNLNGQEVPHLLGGGMNCPSAARLTYYLLT